MSITTRSTTFQTDDEVTLSGTWYLPENPKAVVVLGGATGVPEGYYRRFATWLAESEGLACLTFTYRDMDVVTPKTMRASRVTMQDWAITDGQAARQAARASFPDLSLWVIGHSLGGMMISKQSDKDNIDRVITVGSGLVSHRDHPLPYRRLVWLFWFVLGPISVRLLGYLPGKTIGLGSTLPGPVFWQWRRWCTAGPDGFLADTSLPASDWHGATAPVRLVGISDDEICPPGNAFALARAYPGAQVNQLEIDATEAPDGKLGHFGLFTEAGRAFWPRLIA